MTDSNMELVMLEPHIRWKYTSSIMDFHTDSIYGFPDVYQDYHFFHKMKLEDSDKVDFLGLHW